MSSSSITQHPTESTQSEQSQQAPKSLPSTDELTEKLDEIENLYDQDLTLECAKRLAFIFTIMPHVRNSEDPSYKSVIDRLNSQKFIMILEESKQVKSFLESLENKEDWNLSYKGSDIEVWYKHEHNSPLHSIRIQGTIRAPLLNIATLLYESDLYSQLFWYITASMKLDLKEQHSGFSDYKTGVYLNTYAPWPLYQRDLALYAFAVDALKEDDSIIVLSKSLPVDYLNTFLSDDFVPKENSRKFKRCIMHDSGMLLKPVKDGVTYAQFVYNVDPKLGFLPMAVVNWFARTMCRWSLRALESRARDLDSVSPLYSQRLNERAVYKRMYERLGEYWAKKVDEEEEEEDELYKRNGNFSYHQTNGGVSDHRDKLVSTDEFDINMKPAVPTSILKSLISASESTSTNTVNTASTSALPAPSGSRQKSNTEGMSLRKRISSRLFGS